MPQYLVTFSVGPVQGFITSARRSRDLWSGSWLLSEISKACAKHLYDTPNVTLIFPHIEDKSNLVPNSDFSVGNKIQALIHAHHLNELNTLIATAKQATRQRFIDEVQAVKTSLTNFDNQIRQDIWQNQIDDYVEIQVAWTKVGDTSINTEDKEITGYQQAVQNVGRVLASRKATRDFKPSQIIPYQPAYMLPKSSLDGMRETVLLEGKQLKDSLRKKLSLSNHEQLDVAGVIKRLGFGEKAEQFTPITRITANAWLENLPSQILQPIIEIYETLVNDDLATRVQGNKQHYKKFPYDAQLLYSSRLDKTIIDYPDNKDLKRLRDLLNKECWSNKKYGEPYRYGVLLLADGDRMGELLDNATTLEQHQAITTALTAFAGQVTDTMRLSNGHCIYAGGDDVLGFVPLNTAYQCADNLQQLFFNSLSRVAEELGAKNKPTLSVGLAICHIMTPLSVIRELAGQAEKYAKGDHLTQKDTETGRQRRNALGILLSVRSGTDTKLRFNWNDQDGLSFFEKAIKLYLDKKIPSRVAYDIRAIYLSTCDFAPHDETLYKNIQSAELKRMLTQARTDKGEKIAQTVIDDLIKRGEEIGLNKLADELIVARWFSAKTQKELGKE